MSKDNAAANNVWGTEALSLRTQLKYFVKTTAKPEAIYKYLISEKATTLVVLTLR
jgi:hypothetical protein